MAARQTLTLFVWVQILVPQPKQKTASCWVLFFLFWLIKMDSSRLGPLRVRAEPDCPLLRSGTSIGANIHEAQYAQGKKDFISKLEIAQKECFETGYWLELLFETGYIAESTYKPLQNQCGAIRRMLISSLNTAKEGCR